MIINFFKFMQKNMKLKNLGIEILSLTSAIFLAGFISVLSIGLFSWFLQTDATEGLLASDAFYQTLGLICFGLLIWFIFPMIQSKLSDVFGVKEK